MSHIYQLPTPIPVETTKGPGFCFAWLDYSQEHDTLWKVCITETGEWWDLPQSKVRGAKNVSMGRSKPSLITPEIGAMLQKANDELAAISNCAKCGATWASFYVCKDIDCHLGRNVAQASPPA